VSARGIVVVIREDPERSSRPAEALRIAVGLRTGEETLEVVLLGAGARALAHDASAFEDAEVLETHREALARAGQAFLVEETALAAHPAAELFHVEPLDAAGLARVLVGAARHILF